MKKLCVIALVLFLFATSTLSCFAEDYVQLSEDDFAFDETYKKETQITANFVQEVWPEDLDYLSADVTAEFYDADQQVCSILALYDEQGKLVSVETDTQLVERGTVRTFHLSSQGAKTASLAKLMVWDAADLKPLRETKTIEKIKNAIFLYMDPVDGNDANDGSFEAPIQSFKQAKIRIRQKQYEMEPGDDTIYVILKNGEYFMDQTLTLEQKDVLNGKYNIVFAALETHKAILTGAIDITGFSIFDESMNIYRAYVGTEVNSRQLYADGIRCTRARRDEPPAGFAYENGVITAEEMEFLSFKHIEDLEFSIENNWMHDRCTVASVEDLGNGKVQFHMTEPVWTQISTKNFFSSAEPTYMENAYEFIDEGGEWYLDTHEGYLYYKPRFFEDMQTTRFTMPVVEDFIQINSVSSPITNIDFRGIEFTQSTWLFPSTNGGLCVNQNEAYWNGDGNGIVHMNGVVQLKNVDNVNFYNCKFSKLGKTSLKLTNGVQNCNIIGNEFCDLSAGALSVGGVTDLERNPENTSLAVKNVRVENNFIHNIAEDIKSCAAVSAGFPIDTRIGNNEIYNTGYSGIHTGWGWDSTEPSATKNFAISNNYIHKILNDEIYDGGAVYMLGHTGGSTDNYNELTGNYVEDIRMPFGALYPDQGSSYWKIANNVVDLSKQPMWYYGEESSIPSRWTHMHTASINHIVFDNNYSTTSTYYNRGTSISYQAPKVYKNTNWPEEALEIIAQSGIQPPYDDNFTERLEEFYSSGTSITFVGEKLRVNATPTTSKANYYNPAKFVCYASIRDDGILEYRDGSIYASAKGTTEVKLTAIENNLITEHIITVVVS